MKKRLLPLLLITAMACAITACGKTDSDPSGANGSGSAIGGVEETTVANINSDFNYSSMAGNYSDTYSQRAMMTITEGNNCLEIEVDWSSSWCEYTRWTMTATYDAENNRFVYSNEKREDIASDDAEGGGKCDEVYADQSGYFEWNADTKTLAWTGAHDESCKECAFAMDEYQYSTSNAGDTAVNESADGGETDMDIDSVINASYASLQDEIDAVQNCSGQFMAIIADDNPQQTLNYAARDYYELWDAELNSLWSRLSKELDADAKAKLLEEQRAWINEKETAIIEAGKPCEGGSLQPFLEDMEGGDMTKARVYELAKILADLRGESLSVPQ